MLDDEEEEIIRTPKLDEEEEEEIVRTPMLDDEEEEISRTPML